MSGEVQPRKRKDKKKKREESFKNEDSNDKSSLNDKEDSDEKSQDDDSHDHHHGPKAGILSKFVFFLLFSGLIFAISTVFFQLKGSDVADTPIKESRYANILERFVDEHPPDDHDEAHHVADHDDHEEGEESDHPPDDHGDEHEESEHEHSETHDEEEDSGRDKRDVEEQSQQDDGEPSAAEGEVSEQKTEEITLEPSMPDASEVEKNEIGDADEDDDDDESDDEQASEAEDAPESVAEEPAEENEVQSEKEDESAAENADEVTEAEADLSLDEQHPREEIPTLVDEDNKNEYTKIIDDLLKQQDGDRKNRASYHSSGITNDYDYDFHEELDEAQREMERAPDRAHRLFSSILEKHPKSPRAVYGKALSIDRLSEIHRSNTLLEQSIYMYRDVLDLPNVPDELYMLAGFRCVDRMRFRGFQNKALRVLQRMKERFPKSTEILNQIAVTYLLMSQNDNAKANLEEALKIRPENGFAKVHLGFILKTIDRDYDRAIKLFREGLATEEPGTVDGRFYFHYGDALTRLGKPAEAHKVYEAGVKHGLFQSAYQRSLYNVNSLTARPWWTNEQTTYGDYIQTLEENWEVIRDEAVPLLEDEGQGYFPESEGLKKKGTWNQFEMYARGERIDINCQRAPRTCELISNIPEAAECKRGQVKFSVLLPGTHVWPHTGPTNCRLRAHLGLVVPDGANIRVANETRKWEEGKVLVFDDSFEHEVWHEGDTFRLILIVDFWHPDLTTNQKQMLSAI